MVVRKSNVSARVESTLKRIVNESDFTHKDAYELGAKIIANPYIVWVINSANVNTPVPL